MALPTLFLQKWTPRVVISMMFLLKPKKKVMPKQTRLDVEGIDAAHKLVILASIAFAATTLDGLYTDGITQLEPQDVAYAKELGYVII